MLFIAKYCHHHALTLWQRSAGVTNHFNATDIGQAQIHQQYVRLLRIQHCQAFTTGAHARDDLKGGIMGQHRHVARAKRGVIFNNQYAGHVIYSCSSRNDCKP